MHATIRRRRRGSHGAAPHNDPAPPGARAFERLGDRAWTLALWLTGHEGASGDAVAAAFAMCASAPHHAWEDDGEILREVRLQALARIDAPRRTDDEGGRMAALVAAMRPLQREVIELAVIGRIVPASIARLLGMPPQDVLELLATGLRELAGSGVAVGGGVRAQV